MKNRMMVWLCILALCWNGSAALAVENESLPALINGVGALSDGEGDMLSNEEGDVPPESNGDVPSEGEGDVPPEGEGEVPPEGEGDIPPSQGGETESTPEEPAQTAFHETLGPCRVADGEIVSYTTISSEFAGTSIPGYYPGDLTVELTGQVVIEDGGTLAIETLSVGGGEASPVLKGGRSEGGLIVVKSGGVLRMTSVEFETWGEGWLIVQEPGGMIELKATPAGDDVIQWAPPVVDNQYRSPDDIFLRKGTPLTAEMLPGSMTVGVLTQGREEDIEAVLEWRLEDYDGRTEGELTLTGSFLDQNGQMLDSVLPLEVTVHWCEPDLLVVTKAAWKGDQVPAAQLTVQNLPESAEIWGEVSEDGGKTWSRWTGEQFFIVEAEPEGWCCVFELPDNSPRHFRVMAENAEEHQYWSSDVFYLEPDDADDSGGNRGGSTSPDRPNRKPKPEKEPEEELPEQSIGEAEQTTGSTGWTEVPSESAEQGILNKVQNFLEDKLTQVMDTLAGWGGEEELLPDEAEAGQETLSETPVFGAREQTEALPEEAMASEEIAEETTDTAEETVSAAEASITEQTEDRAAEAADLPAAVETQKETTPDASQIVLAAAGILVCIAAGMAAAGFGRRRNKK